MRPPRDSEDESESDEAGRASSDEEVAAAADMAASALRTLGSNDPYSMCYDPLALLFYLQPDAFTRAPVAIPG